MKKIVIFDDFQVFLIVFEHVNACFCWLKYTTSFFFCFYCRMSSPAFMLVNNDGQDFPEIYQKNGDLGKVSPLRYDRIVCDVPCSGKWHRRENYRRLIIVTLLRMFPVQVRDQ